VKSKLPQVAIIGAGPSGLALANLLQAEGCRTLLIEARREGATASRATGLRNSTLKLLEQLGILNEVLACGCPLSGVQFYNDGIPTDFRSFPGSDARPVDNLSVPQPTLEAALKRRADSLGVEFIEETELIDLSHIKAGVRLTCRNKLGEYFIEAPWVVGADGAHSATRRLLGIGYIGETDTELSFVVDCKLDPPPDGTVMHYFMSGTQRLAIIPLDRDSREFKLSSNLPAGLDPASNLNELETEVAAITGNSLNLRTTSPTTRYRVTRRLASRFSNKRCFLIGDAAHSCPPNGGWGLNTALADAANLAWKLAGAIQHRLPASLLDSYDAERRPAAATVIAFTEDQRRMTFTQKKVRSGGLSEAEHLTQIKCDGDLTISSKTGSDWHDIEPGRNLWELAARRASLAGIAASKPGEFTLLVSASAQALACWREIIVELIDADLPTRSIVVPAPVKSENAAIAALVRPDGIVAVIDNAPGDTLRSWVARLKNIENSPRAQHDRV